MFRIGVDIGGTFTDFAIWKDEGEGYVGIGSYKLPSSRPDYAEAVIQGLEEIALRYGIARDHPTLVVHGTTVSTNAVIERSEPPVALLTTEGYRDLLGIARLRLDKPVDLFNRRPTPLVPRERVFEVRERLLSDGTVDTALDEASVLDALAAARHKGVAAVGICFLNAYRNPQHEVRALELARSHFPDLEVMASHEVWPQQSEYERAVLTLLNVYVRPLMDGYIRRIDEYLKERLPRARLYITKSNGGIMSADEARRLPIHTLLSGPAAGVTAALTVGNYLGLDRIMTLDMGGTSTDVSLIDAGRSMMTGQAEVGDFPLLMPVTAIEAMGAGGGSVAWLDGGVLKVGPRSAGSKPGPACYGTGGEHPTLTDAYLLTNYLSPNGLLGGRIRLDRDRASRAFEPIAEALRTDVVTAAESVIAVATSTMVAKVLPFLARLGVGPSDLSLMIFGGAGGIHGPILADEIGIRRIVVPHIPSVFCAFGCIASDLVHDGVRSTHGLALTSETATGILNDLRHEGTAWLERQNRFGQVRDTAHVYLADVRYAAQSFTIPVDLTSVTGEAIDPRSIAALFHDEHRRLFGHANPDSPVAVDNLRLRTIGRQPKPSGDPLPERSAPAPEPVERRDLRMGGRWHRDAPVFAWNDLPVGWSVEGPAMVQQDLATILVPVGFDARVTGLGDLELVKG
jgi:N-methylhydantoinase A